MLLWITSFMLDVAEGEGKLVYNIIYSFLHFSLCSQGNTAVLWFLTYKMLSFACIMLAQS